MSLSRLVPDHKALPASRLRSTVQAVALALALGATSLQAGAEGTRAEIGKPLREAGEFLKAGKAKEALAKVRDADAVGGKSPAEQLLIDRMKAAAAQRAGDMGTAVQALEAIYSRTSGAEQGQIAEQLASAYAQQRNNAKATEWLGKAVQAGNNGPGIKQLQAYLQSSSGDYGAIAKDAGAAVAAAEQAGRKPDEGELLRLADAQQRTGNMTGYVGTLEKLLLNYPKKDYWNAYLARLSRKPGFGERFGLDVMRLRLASGTLTKPDDFMEMAQLSLQAGVPAEAARVVEQGFKTGLLGSGPEAGRHQRLRDLALKQQTESKASLAAQATEAEGFKEGDGLVKAGSAYVSMGELDKGIELIQKGIAKGGLKHPEDAKLRLGLAQLQSPKTKAAGVQTLRSIKGGDGAAEIGRLWIALGAS
jgi:tetratricopeptide (TPR) repeat protein